MCVATQRSPTTCAEVACNEIVRVEIACCRWLRQVVPNDPIHLPVYSPVPDHSSTPLVTTVSEPNRCVAVNDTSQATSGQPGCSDHVIECDENFTCSPTLEVSLAVTG